MNHDYSLEKQKEYFGFAYQTGSDIWSHLPYQYIAQSMLTPIKEDSLILDLGSGRGFWAMKLLSLGHRVLGIDYIDSIVDSVNKKILDTGYTSRGRILVADVLDIPFTDDSFSLVTDIGTFQHIHKSNWGTYVSELNRVLHHDGYYLNVSLSRKTNQFQGFHPSVSSETEFYKFGVIYNFFSEHEIEKIFESHFEIINQKVESFKSQSDPRDDVALVFTLMKKSNP